MMEKDRVAVLDEACEDDDSAADRILNLSLNVMSGDDAVAVFFSLALCPEDVLVPVAAAQLLCDADLDNTCKITALSVRRSLNKLLDRNLLQGSMGEGVKMHDMVREFTRRRIGDEGATRPKQRVFVRSVLRIANDQQASDELKAYFRLALQQHMSEALLPGALLDDEANAWLESSDDIFGSVVVQSAANATGASKLLAAASRLEAEGDNWHAARRYANAALTEEFAAQSGGVGGGKEAPPTAALIKSVELLEACAQDLNTRSLEVLLRGFLTLRMPFEDPVNVHSFERVPELVELGVHQRSPQEIMQLGLTKLLILTFEPMGFIASGAGNWLSEEKMRQGADLMAQASSLYREGVASLQEDDPLHYVASACCGAGFMFGVRWFFGQSDPGWQDRSWPYERIKWAMETYDVALHHHQFTSYMALDMIACADPSLPCLMRHGDVHLVRQWRSKVQESIVPWLVQATEDSPMEIFVRGMQAINHARPAMRSAGLPGQSLAIARAAGFTYDTADTVGATYAQRTYDMYGYLVDHFTYFGTRGSQVTFKRLGYLLDPGSVDVESLKRSLFLPQEGSFSYQGQADGVGILSFGATAFEAGEVFERLGDLESAIVAAKVDLAAWPFAVINLIDNNTVLGRCYAKLGRLEDAATHFQRAIAVARSIGAPYCEMLAHRDYIVHVLDAQGQRNGQLAKLGAPIASMVLDAAEYTQLLGAGVDAVAAVAAFRRSRAGGSGTE
eukprot:g7755.t1